MVNPTDGSILQRLGEAKYQENDPQSQDAWAYSTIDPRLELLIHKWDSNLVKLYDLEPSKYAEYRRIKEELIHLIRTPHTIHVVKNIYNKLWELYIKVNELIFLYSPKTDINFFVDYVDDGDRGVELPVKIEKVIHRDAILVLFLNVHSHDLNTNEAEMLGKPLDMEFCETSMGRHGEVRVTSTPSLQHQFISTSEVVHNIPCTGSFCQNYTNVMSLTENRNAILNSMIRDTLISDMEKEEYQPYYKGVMTKSEDFLTSRCNHLVNNKRYAYVPYYDPYRYFLTVLRDDSGNLEVGRSLLSYVLPTVDEPPPPPRPIPDGYVPPPPPFYNTFTTQDIINQVYALGYRRLAIISGACLDVTKPCSNEINLLAKELSTIPIIEHPFTLPDTPDFIRGGMKTQKKTRRNKRKNKRKNTRKVWRR
jgi:hypothetical protein